MSVSAARHQLQGASGAGGAAGERGGPRGLWPWGLLPSATGSPSCLRHSGCVQLITGLQNLGQRFSGGKEEAPWGSSPGFVVWSWHWSYTRHGQTCVRAKGPVCVTSVLPGRNRPWRDFSALQCTLSVDGGQEDTSGWTVPSSQRHPVREIGVLPAALRPAPPWKTPASGCMSEA